MIICNIAKGILQLLIYWYTYFNLKGLFSQPLAKWFVSVLKIVISFVIVMPSTIIR